MKKPKHHLSNGCSIALSSECCRRRSNGHQLSGLPIMMELSSVLRFEQRTTTWKAITSIHATCWSYKRMDANEVKQISENLGYKTVHCVEDQNKWILMRISSPTRNKKKYDFINFLFTSASYPLRLPLLMKFQTSSHIPDPLNGHFRANRTVYYEKRSFHPGSKHSNRAPSHVRGIGAGQHRFMVPGELCEGKIIFHIT